jgi:hypothetical protein
MKTKTLLILLIGALVIASSFMANAAYSRQISFSGYIWSVKTSHGKVGPGPNYFSDSSSNVWVDASGRLHMKITKVRNRWNCAEVINLNNLNNGTYRFYLDTAVDNLDPNVVLGLFTWSDNTAYNHREIDIEFSRWGAVNNQNAQYVVQPYTIAQNIHRFDWPSGITQSMHSFDWRATQVNAQSQRGFAVPPASNDVLQKWNFTSGIPQPGDENARINLWLNGGHAPSNAKEVEIIVNKFEFVP